MRNFFIHHEKNIFTVGATHKRYWIPLEFLNVIGLLRREGVYCKLILPQEAKRLAGDSSARFFITTTPIDLWQCPALSLPKYFFQFCRNLSRQNELYVSGYHGTICPELMLHNTGAQAVIRGEPEETIRQICNGIALGEIRGVTFKKESNIVSRPDQSAFDLTKLVSPAYDQIDFNRYRYALNGWKRFALFETSRGCKNNCDFCGKNIMYGKGFRQKTIVQVKQELESAIKTYKVKTGYFFDLDFLNDKEMVLQVCNYLAENSFDFQWCCQTRIDEVDEQILKVMAGAGCRLIHYGVESAQHLQGGKKYLNESAETLRRTIQLTESLGMKTLCFYIIGFSNCFSKMDRDTLDLMHSVDSSYVSLHEYYNFHDSDFAQAHIMIRKNASNGRMKIIIFYQLLSYYLRLRWLKRFLKMYCFVLMKFIKKEIVFVKNAVSQQGFNEYF